MGVDGPFARGRELREAGVLGVIGDEELNGLTGEGADQEVYILRLPFSQTFH